MAEQTVPVDYQSLIPSVHCASCSYRIPADSFEYVYWSADKRLAARCPGCHEPTVLSFRLWRRQMAMSVPSTD